MNNIKKRFWVICKYLIIAVSVISILFGAFLCQQAAGLYNSRTDGVVINEVVVNNLLGLKDNNGVYYDWIELYNGGRDNINLSGYGLSDDEDFPFKYVFKDVVIKKNGYLVIGSSEKNITTELNTGFNIGTEDQIVLTAPNGERIDFINIPNNVDYGTSVGRSINNKQTFAVLSTPTPGEYNRSSVIYNIYNDSDSIAPPVFSVQGGYYSQEFELELKAEDGAIIYYTLDGSEPDKDSYIYRKPIHIYDRSTEKNVYSGIMTSAAYSKMSQKPNNEKVYKGTTVRARSCVDGVFSESCTTNTYFINPKYSFSVISMTTDPANLFSEEDGILVPNTEYKLWKKYNPERPYTDAPIDLLISSRQVPAHIEMFDVNGVKTIDYDVGVSINGKGTSVDRNKSFYISAGKRYNKKGFFEYDFFNKKAKDINGIPIKKYKGIVLRSSDADWSGTTFRDIALQKLIGSYFDSLQASDFCILFIDGEYWGMFSIREKFNEHYFESHYGVKADSVDIVKYSDSILTSSSNNKAIEDFQSLSDFAKNNDLTIASNYYYVSQRLDIDNFIKYIAVETYLDNADYNGNNVRAWRSDDAESKFGDSKWRFALYDLDSCMTLPNCNLLKNMLDENSAYSQWEYVILFRELMKNPDFKQKFLEQMKYLSETCFEPSRAEAMIDSISTEVSPEITEHFSRWELKLSTLKYILNGFKQIEHDHYKVWQQNVEKFKNQIKERNQTVNQLVEELS